MSDKKLRANPNYKHGDYKTKLYTIWLEMNKRCNYSKFKDYKYYGGRGIKVCEEWHHNYIKFKNWALNNGYKEGLRIDRKDNNLGYEPSNCRFATDKQNSYNKRPYKKDIGKYKGVCWNKQRNKWIARIQKDGMRIIIGAFLSEKDAAIAYNKKAAELFGEFAYINEINDE